MTQSGARPRLRILFGAAVGDALGASTEFMSVREAGNVYPPKSRFYARGAESRTALGACTDDTQLIIATLQSFQNFRCEEYLPLVWKLRQNLLVWLLSDPPDMGTVVQRSLRLGTFESWSAATQAGAGNGSLMRAVALNALGVDRKELVALSVLCGAVTHIDPLCVWCCLFLNLFVENLLEGVHWESALRHALSALAESAIVDEALGHLFAHFIPEHAQHRYAKLFLEAQAQVNTAVLDGAVGTLKAQGGFVVDTLRAALAHNVKSARFVDCVLRAARLGHDSDTTASVAGVFASARGWRIPLRLAEPLTAGHSWGQGTLLDGALSTTPLISFLPQLLDVVEQKREPAAAPVLSDDVEV